MLNATNYDQLLGIGLRIEKAPYADRLRAAASHAKHILISRRHDDRHHRGFPAWERFNAISEAYRLLGRTDLGHPAD